jgi:NAD-dependent SIR2 family protein deacetylase
VWQWHFDFIELANKCKPNKSHYEILKFQEYCFQSAGKVNCHLVTQNIDNYDAQLIKASKVLSKSIKPEQAGTSIYGFTPYVLEMHGNVRYMHCSDEDKECSRLFFKAPELH